MKAQTVPLERPIAKILGDIVGNVQDIVRYEVRLAKSELEQQISGSKTAAIVLLAGVLAAAFGVLFALLAIFCAVSKRLPDWASALCVAALMFVVAAAAIVLGKRRLRKMGLPKTAVSAQETVRWANQQTR
jgi:uncharacterized membrane protein YqjE